MAFPTIRNLAGWLGRARERQSSIGAIVRSLTKSSIENLCEPWLVHSRELEDLVGLQCNPQHIPILVLELHFVSPLMVLRLLENLYAFRPEFLEECRTHNPYR